MFRLTPHKSEISEGKIRPPSLQSLSPSMANKSTTVKLWVYNTDLKYAIGDLRSQLINEAKNTNAAMKKKIQEWVSRDYVQAAAHITSKDTPVAKENEAMRQLISDLLNGPIASLLNKDGRNKLCKLSIPALPASGIFLYEDACYDDSDMYPLSGGPSYYSNSVSSSMPSSSHYNFQS